MVGMRPRYDSTAEQLKGRAPTVAREFSLPLAPPRTRNFGLPLQDGDSHKPTDPEAKNTLIETRRGIGSYLAKWVSMGGYDFIALDAYMEQTGQYDAIRGTWPNFRNATIRNAKKILDLTCGTGEIAMSVADLTNHPVTIYANEFCPELSRIAGLKFDRWNARHGARDGREIELTKMTTQPDESQTVTRLVDGMMDVVLWWGSFNMLRGRKYLMATAYDLLKPEGVFIIMEAYPWNLIPIHYVGEEGFVSLATSIRPLEPTDIEERVKRQWMKKFRSEIGSSARAAAIEIPVMVGEEDLHGTVPDEMSPHLTSMCFTKPRCKV